MANEPQSIEALIAGAIARLDMHLGQDSKSFDRIEGALARISDGQAALNEKLERTVARVHDRLEEETGRAIKKAEEVAVVAAAATAAATLATGAVTGDLQKQVTGAHSRISRQTIKIYGLVIATLLTAMGWLIEVTGFGKSASPPAITGRERG